MKAYFAFLCRWQEQLEEGLFDMDMTKTGLWQLWTWATKNAHCANRTWISYGGFSQIWSHMQVWNDKINICKFVRTYRHLRACYPWASKVAREELHVVLSSIQEVAPAFIKVPRVHSKNHIVVGIPVATDDISRKLWTSKQFMKYSETSILMISNLRTPL